MLKKKVGFSFFRWFWAQRFKIKERPLQLTVRDVSKFLNVSEGTVTRWVKRRGLPAQRVSGQFRFNRTELLEWATAHQLKVSLEIFDHLENENEPGPNLAEALEAGGIFYRVPGANKVQALSALVQVLPLPSDPQGRPLLHDRELLLRLLLAREASASTAIGDGIALPHVRNPIVLQVSLPMVTLCFLEMPVNFAAPDGKPVGILFSLICPTMRSHLQMLSRLSYALHDPNFKEVVVQQEKPEIILQEARRVQGVVDGRASATSIPLPAQSHKPI
jgi:PTS system nitrogen regulatory IIA component